MTAQPRVIGNVCPARLEDTFVLRLPHEPVMYDADHFLIPVDPHILSTVILKVCKHCGSIYGESST